MRWTIGNKILNDTIRSSIFALRVLSQSSGSGPVRKGLPSVKSKIVGGTFLTMRIGSWEGYSRTLLWDFFQYAGKYFFRSLPDAMPRPSDMISDLLKLVRPRAPAVGYEITNDVIRERRCFKGRQNTSQILSILLFLHPSSDTRQFLVSYVQTAFFRKIQYHTLAFISESV